MGSRRSRHPKRAIVIGAGLTGLAAARRLAARDAPSLDVLVLDARGRVGGSIWTERVDGFTLEGGADSFITNKPQALELCRGLGLADQLISPQARHRRSLIVRRGRTLPVPEGFTLMAPRRLGPLLTSPILSWRGKLRMLMDLVLPRRLDDVDESLAAFVTRRLGREALDRLVQPLVAGIYTADPTELSLRATLPRFPQMEREHGSLIRAALREGRAARHAERGNAGARYGLFQSLAEGMDTLPRTLADALPEGALRLNTAVRRVSRPAPEKPWKVELSAGPTLEAEAVLIATEAHAAARMVDGLDTELALALRSIPYASSSIVQLAYRRAQVAHPLDGFGVVVPSSEGLSILAASFLNVKFPRRAPEGTALFRVFLGGALRPDLFEREDDELVDLARRELGRLLGVRGEPMLRRVARHPRAMPQYTLGHLTRVAEIRRLAASYAGLVLCGNAFDGVGIPDCIRAGHDAADAALEALAGAPGRAVA